MLNKIDKSNSYRQSPIKMCVTSCSRISLDDGSDFLGDQYYALMFWLGNQGGGGGRRAFRGSQTGGQNDPAP